MAAKAAQQSRQGQNVREKFFLDFANATAKSSDPYRSRNKSEAVEWLPDLLFIEGADEPAFDNSIFGLQSVFSSSAAAI